MNLDYLHCQDATQSLCVSFSVQAAGQGGREMKNSKEEHVAPCLLYCILHLGFIDALKGKHIFCWLQPGNL